jgi:hypothetical protein
MFLVGPTIARSRRVEESKAVSTDGESNESDQSDRRGRHVVFLYIDGVFFLYIGVTNGVEESRSRGVEGIFDRRRVRPRRDRRRHIAIFIKSDESDFVGATPRLVRLTSRRRPDATPRTDESLPPDESGRLVRRAERAL